MSDTVKLIIEMPKETYKGIMLGKWDGNGLAFYVKTGTPLDDVKAEIEEKISHYNHFSSSNTAHGLKMALDILDNIGKESEE